MSRPMEYDCLICGSKLKKASMPGSILFRIQNPQKQESYFNTPATHMICTVCHNVQTFSHFEKEKIKKQPTK